MRPLPLAFQCDRRWSEMSGGSTVRDCQDCGCQVVNLSSLDEASARTLLAERTGRSCVRFKKAHGKIVFAKVRRAVAVAAAAAVLLGAGAVQADTSTPPPPKDERAQGPQPAAKAKAKPKKKVEIEQVGYEG